MLCSFEAWAIYDFLSFTILNNLFFFLFIVTLNHFSVVRQVLYCFPLFLLPLLCSIFFSNSFLLCVPEILYITWPFRFHFPLCFLVPHILRPSYSQPFIESHLFRLFLSSVRKLFSIDWQIELILHIVQHNFICF